MMNDLQQLVKCPECSCSVRSDRLKNHLKKVHPNQEFVVDSDKSTKKVLKSSNSLTFEKFGQVANLINSWLSRKKDYLYDFNNVKILTIMAFENFMGFSFDEINKLYGEKISRDRYKIGAKRLKVTYEQMVDHLYKSFIRYRKHSFDQKIRDRYCSEDNNFDVYADWYACNSVDRIDGSKYVGYNRREYKDSRFGSFPIHDSYGDESCADDNPWE